MNRIMDFKLLKENIANGFYKKGDAQKADITNFVESFWQGRDNQTLLESGENLEELILLHKALIREVIDIFPENQSDKNRNLLKENMNIRPIISQFEDGGSAFGIVIFNTQREYYLVGDIHSDDESLVKVLEAIHFFDKIVSEVDFKVVFLGDYVDRGNAHLKTMEWVMLLKVLFPQVVCLLRGNHDGGKFDEDGLIVLPYRIPEKDDPLSYFPRYLEALIKTNQTVSVDLLSAYFSLFDSLPYLAFLKHPKGIVQCVHGGLPKPQIVMRQEGELVYNYSHLNSLSDLTEYQSLDNAGATIRENLMWSDPLREDEILDISKKRFKYSAENFENYRSKFGVDLLFRGHEVVDDGIREHFNKRVFTVFSSGCSETSFYRWVNPKIVWINHEGKIEGVSLYEEC